MLDFPHADDVSNACVSIAEASVSTPEDVCNRIKKNQTGFEKDTFLPLHVVRQSTLSAYADDTQIFFADSTAEKVEEVINADLANVDKWYEQNGMKRNASKYQAIVMGKSQVKTTILLRKHCFSHYRRIGNAWCCCRRQNEIREAYSKCMQKSLPADRCTQANEKDPSI